MARDGAEQARENAGRVQDDPALRAVQELDSSIKAGFEVIEEDVKKVDEKADSLFETAKKDAERLRTEVAAGFKVQGDKINALERRQIAIGGSFRDIEGCCLAALSPEQKADIGLIDWSMPRSIRERKDDLKLLSNPVARTAVAHWFLTQYKLQKRRYQNHQEQVALFEQIDRIEKALADLFPAEKAAALTTGTSGLGGSFIPDPVAAELYRLILDNSIIGSLATHVPMASKTLELPIEGSSGLTVTWGTEGSAITDSVPSANATSKITLTANRLNGLAVSSIEELQDSAVSIISWVQTKLTEMAGREIDNQALEGTGSPFTGLLGNSSVNATTTGANGDAVTYAAIVALIFKARERASRQGARFFMAPEMMAKILGLVDSQGQPIVTFGRVPEGVAPQILGYPAEVHSVIRADRTYGTGTTLSTLYFGPPAQIVIGDRMGMSWDVSDQVGFTSAQVNMRLMTRLAIAVGVPKGFSRYENLDV